jgi:hypothetical protein
VDDQKEKLISLPRKEEEVKSARCKKLFPIGSKYKKKKKKEEKE